MSKPPCSALILVICYHRGFRVCLGCILLLNLFICMLSLLLLPLLQRLELPQLMLLLLLTGLVTPTPCAAFQVSASWNSQTRSQNLLGGPLRPHTTAGSPPPYQGSARWVASCSAVGLAPPRCSFSRSSVSNQFSIISTQDTYNNNESEPLPLWEQVFSKKFLFSDSLPTAIPPLHAALFEKINIAARLGGSSGGGLGVFSGGAPAACAAAAAAAVAVVGSWRILTFVARSLRGVTTKHRLAEAKAYGPLHSLDATIKPLHKDNAESSLGRRGSSSSVSSRIATKTNTVPTYSSNNSISLSNTRPPPSKEKVSSCQRNKQIHDGADAAVTNRKGFRLPRSSDDGTSASTSSSSTSNSTSSSKGRRGRKPGKGRNNTTHDSGEGEDADTASPRMG